MTAEFLVENPGHVRLSDNDQEIVDRATALQAASGRVVVLATFDIGMKVRGQTAGLEVLTLET